MADHSRHPAECAARGCRRDYEWLTDAGPLCERHMNALYGTPDLGTDHRRGDPAPPDNPEPRHVEPTQDIASTGGAS